MTRSAELDLARQLGGALARIDLLDAANLDLIALIYTVALEGRCDCPRCAELVALIEVSKHDI